MSSWTDAATGRLKVLWENYSCAAISTILETEGLGTFTKCAVIGKVHRLGLTVKQKSTVHPSTPLAVVPRTHVARRHQVGAEAFKITRAVRRKAKEPEVKPEPFVCQELPDLPFRHLALLDLEYGDCRWPSGTGPFTFCGHPQQLGSSYCPSHHRLSRGEGTPSERAAHMVDRKVA
jgi:GcrA cell cycle regulator